MIDCDLYGAVEFKKCDYRPSAPSSHLIEVVVVDAGAILHGPLAAQLAAAQQHRGGGALCETDEEEEEARRGGHGNAYSARH